MTKTKSRKIGAVMVLAAMVAAYLLLGKPGIDLPWRITITYGILIVYGLATTFFFIAPFRVR